MPPAAGQPEPRPQSRFQCHNYGATWNASCEFVAATQALVMKPRQRHRPVHFFYVGTSPPITTSVLPMVFSWLHASAILRIDSWTWRLLLLIETCLNFSWVLLIGIVKADPAHHRIICWFLPGLDKSSLSACQLFCCWAGTWQTNTWIVWSQLYILQRTRSRTNLPSLRFAFYIFLYYSMVPRVIWQGRLNDGQFCEFLAHCCDRWVVTYWHVGHTGGRANVSQWQHFDIFWLWHAPCVWFIVLQAL